MTQATGGRREDMTAQQRAALVTIMFYLNKEYTVGEIASATGLKHNSAWDLLRNISPIVPLMEPETSGGKWRLVPKPSEATGIH